MSLWISFQSSIVDLQFSLASDLRPLSIVSGLPFHFPLFTFHFSL